MRNLLASTFLVALGCASCGHSGDGCATNSDCPDKTRPLCDPVSRTCVGCSGDKDCPANQVCMLGACVPGCDAQHPCKTGQCDPQTHACVPCLSDQACSGMTPHCNPASHMCVPCLPSADDCPAGSFCGPDDTCHPGCKTDGDCPMGKCQPDHSCASCTDDKQCAGGKICDGGMCVAPCGPNAPCSGGRSCCNMRCTDEKSDAANCGGCGTACGNGESCCAGACAALDSEQNCGGCGTACAMGQKCCGGACSAVDTKMACGTCGNVCKMGEDCCGGACVSLSDPSHCGACGTVCAMGYGCCGGACASLVTPQNCGMCGVACQPGEFCDGMACQKPVYPNFCNNPKVVVIHDTIKLDDAAGDVMASTIPMSCPNHPNVSTGIQTDPKLVDQATGEPLAGGGVTYVLAGGPYANKVVKWLELTEKATRIYFASDGINYYWKKRADDSVAAMMPGAGCTAHHDQFITELTADPNNATLSLIGYGACAGSLGTRAAAFHYANEILPNRMKYPDAWYVFDWADTDNDGAPSAGDTYKILASGM